MTEAFKLQSNGYDTKTSFWKRACRVVKGWIFCSVIFWTSLMGILFLPVYTIPTLLTRPDLFRELGDQIIASSIVSYVVRVLQLVYLLGISLSTFNYVVFCLHLFYIIHLNEFNIFKVSFENVH